MTNEQIKLMIEAAIFAASEPLSIAQIKKLFADFADIETTTIKDVLAELTSDWQERGIELKEVASGFRFQVKAEVVPYLKNLWRERPPRYSRAFLETLALIAYRQPVTRAEVEDIRGVATSSNIIKTMIERNWVRVVGHRDMPGRPELLATTHDFLDYFNLKSLQELPSLRELQDIEQVSESLAKLLGTEIVDEKDPAAIADAETSVQDVSVVVAEADVEETRVEETSESIV